MDTTSGTVTVWQSGRLAPQRLPRRAGFSREQALGTALLLLSAVVLALYVAVLERDVARGELQHGTQRSRAVAEARCEADRPAPARRACVALFEGDELAGGAAGAPVDAAADPTSERSDGARAATISMLATAR